MAVTPFIRNVTVTKGVYCGELDVTFYLHYAYGYTVSTVLGWEGVTGLLLVVFFFSHCTKSRK